MSRVYFTDRDLGKQFPRILAESGLVVERHSDLFAPDGSDEEWLEHCGKNGRIAISHNSRIRYVPNELEAVATFKVPLLILVGKLPTGELAHNVVSTISRIESAARPAHAALHREGASTHAQRLGQDTRRYGTGRDLVPQGIGRAATMHGAQPSSPR